MESVIWALASAYKGNKKILKGLSWKSSIENKKKIPRIG
jgi:hypothetical protein